MAVHAHYLLYRKRKTSKGNRWEFVWQVDFPCPPKHAHGTIQVREVRHYG